MPSLSLRLAPTLSETEKEAIGILTRRGEGKAIFHHLPLVVAGGAFSLGYALAFGNAKCFGKPLGRHLDCEEGDGGVGA